VKGRSLALSVEGMTANALLASVFVLRWRLVQVGCWGRLVWRLGRLGSGVVMAERVVDVTVMLCLGMA